MDDLSRRLEALLYISPRPIPTADLAAACERGEDEVTAALAALGA